MLIGTHDEDAPTEIVIRTLDYKDDFFVLFCCYFICKEERNSSQIGTDWKKTPLKTLYFFMYLPTV